jgi:hypothetical protein
MKESGKDTFFVCAWSPVSSWKSDVCDLLVQDTVEPRENFISYALAFVQRTYPFFTIPYQPRTDQRDNSSGNNSLSWRQMDRWHLSWRQHCKSQKGKERGRGREKNREGFIALLLVVCTTPDRGRQNSAFLADFCLKPIMIHLFYNTLNLNSLYDLKKIVKGASNAFGPVLIPCI